MAQKIRILLADDSYQVRQSIKAMLAFEPDQFEIIGEAENGQQLVTQATSLLPDVVVTDINMPELDGLSAAEQIMAQSPTGIVVVSVQGEHDYFRRAMKAGVADYLVKPFSCDELTNAIRNAALRPKLPAVAPKQVEPEKQGKVVTVFATKGGVGKTTLAANLGAAIAQQTKARVALLDLDLEFGSLGTVMGVRPQGTLVDLCRLETKITTEHTGRIMVRHSQCSASVLCAPPLPHLASEVEGEGRQDRTRSYITEIVEALRSAYDYVIIDTASNFRETNLIAFDKSDLILLVTQPEIPTLETTGKALDVMLQRLEYPKEKVQVVLNRADTATGMTVPDIERSLGVPVSHQIPSDGAAVVYAGNVGAPFVLRRSRSDIGDAVLAMAKVVVTGEAPAPQPQPADKQPAQPPLLRRVFGIA